LPIAARAETAPPPRLGGALTLIAAETAQPVLAGLLPIFERQTGVRIALSYRPAGQALALARQGQADAVLLDDPLGERALVTEQLALARHEVMYTEAIVIGPLGDPAGIAGMVSAIEAFVAIARTQSRFVSRGDDSGIHRMERRIWQEAVGSLNIEADAWYAAAKADTRATVALAVQRNAYALIDRPSWLAGPARRTLVPMVGDDPRLLHSFGLVTMDPARFPRLNAAQADAFARWLVAPEAQEAIGRFAIGTERPFAPQLGQRQQ
jgi:tungstate transport system substrate-binding protein